MSTPRTQWWRILLLWLAGLLAAAQFAKVSTTLEALALIYPDAGARLPLVVSMVGVVGIILGVTAGLIVARIGVRKVLLTGLVVSGGLSLLQAILPPFPVMLGLRLLESAAHLSIVVSVPTLMAAIAAAKDRPLVMGIWGMFFGVGFALTAFLVPFGLEFGGVSAVYASHGALMLVMAVILRPSLPRGVTGGGLRRLGFLAQHIAIYSNPRIIAPALGFLWHTLMFLAVLTYLPGMIGAWTAPFLPIFALVGTLGAGLAAKWIEPGRIVLWGLLATILGFALLVAVPDVLRIPTAFVALFLMGIVPGASFAAVPALNVSAEDQALANGAIAQLGNVGTTSGTPIFALVLVGGLQGLAALTILISMVGTVAVWLIHRKIAD